MVASRAPQLLVQLSDCHILADPDGLVRGVATQRALRAALAHVQALPPDLLLVSGDLAHDGAAASYDAIAAIVEPLGCAVGVLPGNRDHPATLRARLAPWCDPVRDVGPYWRVVMLDSTVSQASHGHLSGAQFALLDQAVANAGGRHILVALHHNPVADRTDAPDLLMLDNARIVVQHLTAWQAVRVVVWGHVHRAYDCRVDNMRMLAAPSTAFQFKIEDGRYVQDLDAAAGYRWLKLYDDGSIATGIYAVPRLA